METTTNKNTTLRCCSHCGKEGHTIRTCKDDSIREFEIECSKRVQGTTSSNELQLFLVQEYIESPSLIKAFAIRKCKANAKTRENELVKMVIDYTYKTYVYNGHQVINEESEEVEDVLISSMIYALRREHVLFTISQILIEFIGEGNNQEIINENNKLKILSTINNNEENEDIHKICECNICYEENKVENYVKFGCNHEFCKGCNTMKTRKNNNINCAICRTEVKTLESRTTAVKSELDEYIE